MNLAEQQMVSCNWDRAPANKYHAKNIRSYWHLTQSPSLCCSIASLFAGSGTALEIHVSPPFGWLERRV